MILKREPAIWLTLVATAVRLLAAFVIDLTDTQQAWLNAAAAAAAGLIVAVWVKREGQVPAILGFVQALLSVAFGLHMDAEHQATIMSFVGAFVAFYVRTQVVAPVPAEVPAHL
jgi:uncharacterized membrane protein AbrB (regulator of aidB expression)